ncbi:MAG: GNAT family N-acetyltransferase [Clostridia bacterium]|nr:GNAT family N-acetyltransferase [Clostridia bacterium]
MQSKIRPITEQDRKVLLQMMRKFYSSPAVFTGGSEEIFQADINNCLAGSPYLEGYVFDDGKTVQGYAMVAKSFSTEFGRTCIWIEDLYIQADFRGLGIGNMFLHYIEDKYPDSILRLEVEEENERAVRVYKKFGFTTLPYMEMKK